MVLIICKKCNSESEMPNKRFKICLRCNKRKTVDIGETETGICVENLFTITSIYFLIPSITEYLTIYDTYNIYQTCKEFRDILIDEKIWISFVKRDFNFSIPPCVNPLKFAIALDTCNVCTRGFIKENGKYGCSYKRDSEKKKICKTECLDYYKLTENELSLAKYERKYNNFFKKEITLYKLSDIEKIVCDKYNGITNFKLFRYKIDNILALKRQQRLQNKERKEREFYEWETVYKTTFDYSQLCNEERRELLDNTLYLNNMVRRADSRLCAAFINGHVLDKHIDHIVALLKMTSIMFSYNTSVYNEYDDLCKNAMAMLMFKNRNNKLYTWDDAVDDTHNTFKKRFKNCRTVYYYIY
jgi:hypothetical protein